MELAMSVQILQSLLVGKINVNGNGNPHMHS